MSLQSAKDFLKKIKDDKALEEKLEAAEPKTRPQIVKDAGFEFTKEEYHQAAEELGAAQELTAEELQGVAGGVGYPYQPGGPIRPDEPMRSGWCVFNWKEPM